MKKTFFILLLSFTITYAKLQITSFQSDFIQTVTNEQNKTLHYKGEIFFKAPGLVKWSYSTPLPKAIYIKDHEVTIIDKTLEQVLIKRVDPDFDFKRLLELAKKVTDDHYRAKYGEKIFDIFLKNGKLCCIQYQDDLGNRVKIEFLHPKQNVEIDRAVFEFRLDPSWDVVYEQ